MIILEDDEKVGLPELSDARARTDFSDAFQQLYKLIKTEGIDENEVVRFVEYEVVPDPPPVDLVEGL